MGIERAPFKGRGGNIFRIRTYPRAGGPEGGGAPRKRKKYPLFFRKRERANGAIAVRI